MPHPTDPLVADLFGVYAQAVGRLENLVRDGLRRGLDPGRLGTAAQERGDSSLAYRQRQLQQARELLAALDAQAGQIGPLIVGRAYRGGLVSVDRSVGSTRFAGQFGRVHVRAVEALAQGMTDSLRAAVATTGQNVVDVFARADMLEGGLPRDGRVADVPFIGRRIDDPYRRFALDVIAEGTVALDTRRQTSAELARRLVNEGVTDAVTGFVDRSGTRWGLAQYTGMVARTTTREAATWGTVNRMTEGGLDLVTISSHDHKADECSPWDGGTFSLTGRTPGYELAELPPYHPNAILGDEHEVSALDGFLRGLRAVYDGPAVEIEGASGVRLTVSPNHPVLTRRGWLPAGMVRKGDEVLRDARPHRPVPRSVPDQYLHDVPARVAQVHEALGSTSASRRTVAAASDLHGDARWCEREVDVVGADRYLLQDLRRQQRPEVLLVPAPTTPLLSRSGSPAHDLGRVAASVARPLPDDYAQRTEASSQGGRGEWAAERQFLQTRACTVAVDQVREVRYLDRWRGHAFDVQTGSGLVFAGGILTHNCEHVATPAAANLDDFEAELERFAEANA